MAADKYDRIVFLCPFIMKREGLQTEGTAYDEITLVCCIRNDRTAGKRGYDRK